MQSIDLFLGATPIIKIVMIGLVLASFWSWTIIISKYLKLKRLKFLANRFEDLFWSGGSLDDLYERIKNRLYDPMSMVFCAAMGEWRKGSIRNNMQQRIERSMNVALQKETAKLESNMGFLASTGSTATFVGLFGTVLGIMNSFQAIAQQQNTNLAVVAPGIAEALFATALGLVVAIPAMVAYNKLVGDIERYQKRLEAFILEFSGIISRQLEERA